MNEAPHRYGATIGFTAHGQAKPQGSQESRFVPALGRTVSHEKRSVLDWRTNVAQCAALARPEGFELIDGPVEVECTFYRPRPKSWPKRRQLPSTSPDIDKLVRAVGDALEGVLYRNDGQTVDLIARKRCGDPARCEVIVREIVEGLA